MSFLNKFSFFRIIGSLFPIHILFGHLKYNLISLFYWALLFLIISDSLGSAFGVPFLFFSPEYLGKVNGWSFLLLGFSVGGFTMAFNTYSYIKLGPRYPFLATVSRPFFKFCLNNSLIPFSFILLYLFEMITFQRNEELATSAHLFEYSLSFLLGFTAFITFSIFYFFPTTREKKSIVKEEESSGSPIQSVTQSKQKWYDYFRTEKQRTYYYFGKRMRLLQSRTTHHLDKSIIEKVFAKNRINASIFEILTITSFIISGQFIDYPVFEFPAGMSLILLLTIVHMLFSAMMSWFHRWTYPIIFLVIALMNYLSLHSTFFNYKNYAYGLDYSEEILQEYSSREIEKVVLKDNSTVESKQNMISILENWRRKTGVKKPKLIILNTSGGGSRSSLWTFTVLQNCDKALSGQLSEHLNLITGASGGMIGAAYYREIALRHAEGEIKNKYDPNYAVNLGKDLLNKLLFSASTNDLFFRYQTFSYNKHDYTKDRGHAFEEHLHKNTNNLLKHDIGYYEKPEKQAVIPLMIFSPTIVNDGRRLLISSQSLSFITNKQNAKNGVSTSFENIDFQTFFAKNEPMQMRFSSVLRASATFPFIMPMITMPTFPSMQLMDAGIRDNYGGKTALDYLYALQNWIRDNTSGVIILEIRDTKRIISNEYFKQISLKDKLTLPFGNMYHNFPRTQNFDQEQLLKVATAGFNFPVDIITFNLREKRTDRISLSWHLTKQEKMKIANAFNSLKNQSSFQRLKKLLKVD